MKTVIIKDKHWLPEDVLDLVRELEEFRQMLLDSYDFTDAKEVENAEDLLRFLSTLMENKHA